jgi:hypothetical protein
MSRSTVREEVAAALLQGAANHEFDAARCERMAALGLRSIDRYVNGLIVLALGRQPEAPLARLLPFLVGRTFQPARLVDVGG